MLCLEQSQGVNRIIPLSQYEVFKVRARHIFWRALSHLHNLPEPDLILRGGRGEAPLLNPLHGDQIEQLAVRQIEGVRVGETRAHRVPGVPRRGGGYAPGVAVAFFGVSTSTSRREDAATASLILPTR